MSTQRNLSSKRLARGADRLYGELLIALAALSAAAPLFVEATLAWALLLAGLAGLWWIGLDRTPRGMVAAAGWCFITLGLGAHLTFHVGLGVAPLEATLGLGLILLGFAELMLGIGRYRRRSMARLASVAGGAGAMAFGIGFPFAWPDVPSWLAAAAVAAMFATFGASLLVGDAAGRARRMDETVQPREALVQHP